MDKQESVIIREEKAKLEYLEAELSDLLKQKENINEKRKKWQKIIFPGICEDEGEQSHFVPIDNRSPRLRKIYYDALRTYHIKIKPIEEREQKLKELIRKTKRGIEADIKAKKQKNKLPHVKRKHEYWLDKVNNIAKELKLPKGVTIPRETKYKIAVLIGYPGVPKDFIKFKSGERTYQIISKMLSEHGYSKKEAAKFHQ